ncbi:hypothetical protein KC333_g6605 [Hortaea werneckii]|nr:hypothetical protein KC333_g6605 [Hortaea werneckii]KAI7310483.1 hypothetical protein KC326_g6671 [Hortaea werneckii]
MIQRALQLQRPIELYCARHRAASSSDYDIAADTLDAQDWEELRHFSFILKPFFSATKRLEGHAATGTHGAVWEVLPAYNYLFNKLSQAQQEVINEPFKFTDYYTRCIDMAFQKLLHYYTLTDHSRIYRVATALHPGKRFQWFED